MMDHKYVGFQKKAGLFFLVGIIGFNWLDC
jgi:hypothetical protein